jgi:tRNA A-37 threonylcarbamoyl transferase component Bud32
MLLEIKRHASWRCLSNPRQQQWAEQLPDIPKLLEILVGLAKPLKDNHRSLVKLGQLAGKQIIAKQPRDKNGRLWARTLSYFEPTEVAQTLSSLERFHQLGIPSVQPLFILEKRVLGAVVDSWICYEFKEGVACNESHLPEVIEFLKKMHLANFRHNDPNLKNFILDTKGEMFVLDSRGRNRSGNFSDANDFFLLKKINKTLTGFNVAEVSHLDTSSLGYRLALIYTRLKSARSLIKDKIRKNRPKNNH